jgi:N-formylglutamate deformylase
MSPFHLSAPLDGRSPLLLSSPHSGTHFPAWFLSQTRLKPATLRRLEDAHVGSLLAPASAHAPLIEATHARAVIDLNRAETDLDPALVPGAAATPSDRTRAGFGLLPRIAAPGHAIYPGRLAAGEAGRRIALLHRPWHAAIAQGLARARAAHGLAILLDCHSMPPLGAGGAEIVLGDRFGASATPDLVARLEDGFRAAGLRVARNAPYAGGHTLDRHGRPEAGIHAIQLEICRNLYMNPETLVPHAGFTNLSWLLAHLVEALLPGAPLALAAE